MVFAQMMFLAAQQETTAIEMMPLNMSSQQMAQPSNHTQSAAGSQFQSKSGIFKHNWIR